jgi:toxin YhaV
MTSISAEERFRSMDPPPPRVNGWWLLAWSEFGRQLGELVTDMRRLRARDPEGYASHPRAKLLATVLRLVREDIPRDPADPGFRQGGTLGAGYTGWHRARFHQRFRLFFRFRSADRVIVYAWMNQDTGLRKAGDRNDPYHVFRRMLDRGEPPTDFDELLQESLALRHSAEDNEDAGR